jgi:hypothetical protein
VRLDGERARSLFEPVTLFPVARALRSDEGAPLGKVSSFLSGLAARVPFMDFRNAPHAAWPDFDAYTPGGHIGHWPTPLLFGIP